MNTPTINVDHRLAQLTDEAWDRLIRVPGKPTAAEHVADMYEEMARRFGGGFHPDTPADGYVKYPEGYNAEVVAAVMDLADEHDLDVYELCLRATR